MFLLPLWEAAWLPRPVDGIPERVQARKLWDDMLSGSGVERSIDR